MEMPLKRSVVFPEFHVALGRVHVIASLRLDTFAGASLYISVGVPCWKA